VRDRGGFKTLYEALWDHQALFQKSNGVNSRFLPFKDVEEISHFHVISKWTPRSDANTETADQIRRLISFPVPLELRLGEGIILQLPNFFLFYEVRQETSFVICFFFHFASG